VTGICLFQGCCLVCGDVEDVIQVKERQALMRLRPNRMDRQLSASLTKPIMDCQQPTYRSRVDKDNILQTEQDIAGADVGSQKLIQRRQIFQMESAVLREALPNQWGFLPVDRSAGNGAWLKFADGDHEARSIKREIASPPMTHSIIAARINLRGIILVRARPATPVGGVLIIRIAPDRLAGPSGDRQIWGRAMEVDGNGI